MTLLRGACFSLLVTVVAFVIVYLVCIAVTIYKEHNALLAERDQRREVVTPLQLEGFQLAAEIREFALSFGDLDTPPPPVAAQYRKALWEHLHTWIGSYPPEQNPQLRARMMHGFEARKLRERVEEYMHRVGEAGAPIINAAGFTDNIFDRRSLCRLSADIEIVAISTNHFPAPRSSRVMSPDKPIPDPTPQQFHDLLDKAATTAVPASPRVPKGKPASSSAPPKGETSGA
jgi:hypothetical protein